MVAQELIAIDVALLLPEAVHARARLINEVLWKQRTDGFRFDQSHLPHITLVQQFVRRANLPALLQRIDSIVGATAALTLRVLAVGSHQSTAFFLLQRTPDLQRLHATLMDAVKPWEESEGAVESFYSEGEPARDADVEWVKRYRTHASYDNFVPHITLGI